MKIKTLSLGLIQSNCYLISTEKAALVIDPGFEDDRVLEFLRENAEKSCRILLTHVHFDHIGGAATLQRETGTAVAIGRADGEVIADPHYNLTDRFRVKLGIPQVDLLDDGDTFTVGDLTVRCIETPGHSAGGMCFLVGDVLFSGDTLFAGSVGRTDFITGDHDTLMCSIQKLFALPEHTVVYPGHGPSTTLHEERLMNPYLR